MAYIAPSAGSFCTLLRSLIGLLLVFLATGTAAAALPQRIYVWQRAWTDTVQKNVAEGRPGFAGMDVLAAEISWADERPVVRHFAPDWAVVRRSNPTLGLVVRIGPYRGSWETEDLATRAIVESCRTVLAEARAQGCEPAELQIDFDAATTRLKSYRELLRTLRREVRPPRLTITTLPDWLRSDDFAGLIRETDVYILQVHSLEKPAAATDDYTLCDPVRAAGWIAQAARLDHPFRIALPTYGYRLIFDVAGKFTALEAEGPIRTWPADHQIRTVTADAPALAKFVQQLLASPPPACESLVWFRLPSDNDGLAWSWPALRAVMQGRPPLAKLVLVAHPGVGGTHDLRLENRGEADSTPAAFRVTWLEARLLAVDALAGWQFERTDAHTLIVRPPSYESNGALRAGESLPIGWLRFDQPTTPSVVPFP